MRFIRPFAVIAVCGLAVFSTGCNSNNKDRILGDWKLVDSPAFNSADAKAAQEAGLYLAVSFRPDNTLTIAFKSDNPETLELVKRNMPGGKTSFNGKYKLGMGENVELYDLDQEAQQTLKLTGGRWIVTINGDSMSVQTAMGVEKYTRLTSTKPAMVGGKTNPPEAKKK